jgi:Flp pilus assembly protein TadG
MPLRRSLCPQRPAAAIVEFAVLLPLLVFLIVVGVDFARIYYFDVILNNAARNGAVYGSSYPTKANDTAGIQNAALADTTDVSPSPTVTSTTGTDQDGNPYVSVTVSWDFYTVVPYPGIPQPVSLSRTVQMRVSPAQPNGS